MAEDWEILLKGGMFWIWNWHFDDFLKLWNLSESGWMNLARAHILGNRLAGLGGLPSTDRSCQPLWRQWSRGKLSRVIHVIFMWNKVEILPPKYWFTIRTTLTPLDQFSRQFGLFKKKKISWPFCVKSQLITQEKACYFLKLAGTQKKLSRAKVFYKNKSGLVCFSLVCFLPS